MGTSDLTNQNIPEDDGSGRTKSAGLYCTGLRMDLGSSSWEVDGLGRQSEQLLRLFSEHKTPFHTNCLFSIKGVKDACVSTFSGELLYR